MQPRRSKGFFVLCQPDCRRVLGCILVLLHTYLPITSFLVHRPPYWVSHILRLPHLRARWYPLKVDPYGSDTYNTIVALDGAEGIWSVENLLKIPEGTHPQITPGELLDCENIVKNDARVQALAKEVGKWICTPCYIRILSHSFPYRC